LVLDVRVALALPWSCGGLQLFLAVGGPF